MQLSAAGVTSGAGDGLAWLAGAGPMSRDSLSRRSSRSADSSTAQARSFSIASPVACACTWACARASAPATTSGTARQSATIFIALASLLWRRWASLAIQPLLRWRETVAAPGGRAEIDSLPFGVEARDLHVVDPAKQRVRETRDPLGAVVASP